MTETHGLFRVRPLGKAIPGSGEVVRVERRALPTRSGSDET